MTETMRMICLVANKKNMDEHKKYNKGIVQLMNFWGNGKALCDAYVEAEREKVRIEQERIRREKERKEKERKEREAKKKEEEAKKKGEQVDLYKERKLAKQKSEREPRKVLMSNGEYADVPFINTEPTGLIGKRAQLEIEKIRLSREEKAEMEYLEMRAKEAKEERNRIKALEDFQKRKIEHNVATGNRKDEKKSIVFKEGEVRQMKDFEKRHGLPEIELFDLEMEEERDANAIRLFLKKYSKLWRFFYHKYANMCYSHKSINNFDDLKNKNESINLAELRKLCDDHGYDKKKWLTKEELKELVKLVNFKVMKRYDAEAMNYEGFKEWILQFALYVYSKDPHDYSAFPPLKSLELMLQKMKFEAEKRKQPTILYEDPDATGI
jgi:hypothetical protein